MRSTVAPYTESRLTRSVANERVGFPVVEQGGTGNFLVQMIFTFRPFFPLRVEKGGGGQHPVTTARRLGVADNYMVVFCPSEGGRDFLLF